MTYSSENLPPNGSLVKSHFQDFMKRLRERIKPRRVRYYHCGEYGETNGRPHYHAIFFGFDFDDKVVKSKRNGFTVWTSQLLDDCWGLGACEIGTVTFESCAYVARYVMKKVTGPKASEHYMVVDHDGVISIRAPEYVTMSRFPGIGNTWSVRYMDACIRRGYVVVNGVKCGLPRYYVDQFRYFSLAKGDMRALGEYAEAREARMVDRQDDNTVDRLAVREEIVKRRIARLQRGVD